MITLHEITDAAKAQALAEAMARDGWTGSPLVADGDQLITGTHRHYAWTRLLDNDEADIPTIDIRDIFAAEGLNYDALMADEMQYSIWDDAIVYVLTHYLSADTCDRYGIDIH